MSLDKVRAILDWPPPTTLRQLRAFLGFCNFYRRFIHQYSLVARPLHRLTEKNRACTWTEAEQKAFDGLKMAFMTAPVLRNFDPNRVVVIEADASDFAIAAVLSQHDDDGVLHPVAFHSRKLIPAELNYPTHDKEMLAMSTPSRLGGTTWSEAKELRSSLTTTTWRTSPRHEPGTVDKTIGWSSCRPSPLRSSGRRAP